MISPTSVTHITDFNLHVFVNLWSSFISLWIIGNMLFLLTQKSIYLQILHSVKTFSYGQLFLFHHILAFHNYFLSINLLYVNSYLTCLIDTFRIQLLADYLRVLKLFSFLLHFLLEIFLLLTRQSFFHQAFFLGFFWLFSNSTSNLHVKLLYDFCIVKHFRCS